ncbi:MAG: sulfatase-like hydrolase/transferase, partial [Verrucomicrobiales bacterium]
MADDLGYGDPQCYQAASKIPTPNMDRLASEGMLFTDAHTPSAVCTPTRYGVLTGRYCWRSSLKSGVLWGKSPALISEDRLTVAGMLQRYGYHTGVVGKWHLGLGQGLTAETNYAQSIVPGTRAAGFDDSYIIPASLDMDPY